MAGPTRPGHPTGPPCCRRCWTRRKALSRFDHDRENVAGLVDANASAARAVAKTVLRFRGGTVTLTDALDAERQRIEAQSSLAEAQAKPTTDWTGLQSSLGLGWGSIVTTGDKADPPGR